MAAKDRKVVLKGTGTRNEDDAGGTITPGDLVDFDGSGDVIRHASAGGNASPRFAVEQDFIGAERTVDYTVGQLTQHETLSQGQQIGANVAASAPAIVKGDYLESAGDGTLRAALPQFGGGSPVDEVVITRNLIAQALEDVDNSGGGAVVRIVAEIV